MKKTFGIVVIATICAVWTVAHTSSHEKGDVKRLTRAGTPSVSQDPFVDNEVAYRVFFRVIASPAMQSNPQALRAYLRRMGVGPQRCSNCGDNLRAGTEDEVAAIIALAKKLQAEAVGAERQLRAQNQGRTDGAIRELARAQRNAAFLAAVESLPHLVGPEAAASLHAYVSQTMKARIKIIPLKSAN